MKLKISSAMKKPVIPIPPNLPVGFRFEPTDTELIGYYLTLLLGGFYNHDMPIGVVNFWELEPWELPGRSRIKSDDQVWYFFCQRVLYTDKKRKMFKRKTRGGHWKPTGESTVIDDLGKRTTLRFYKDSPKVEKTDWIAYEYEITQSSTLSNPDEWVIIKLMNSSGEKRTKLKSKISKSKCKGLSTSACDQNQSLDEVLTTSDSCEISANFETQNVVNMPTMSTCAISQPSNLMASACEMMSHEVAPSDFEYQNTEETNAIWTHDISEPRSQATSGHLSVTEVRGSGYFPMGASLNIPENQKESVQSNCLVDPDSENQRVPSEVEDSASKATSSDDNQQAPDETYLSCPFSGILEELDLSDLCSPMDFDVDNEANEEFPEVDAGVLAEMSAFYELQYCVNQAAQQTVLAEQCM